MAGSASKVVHLSEMVVHRRYNSTQQKSWKPGDQATGASGLARTARQWGGLDRRSAGIAG